MARYHLSFARLPGALLLGLAFLALTAEGAARTDPAVTGLFIPASDVIAVLWPEKLVALEIWVVRAMGEGVWNGMATTILALPAWITLAVLGAGFLWLAARGQPAPSDIESGLAHHQLFENLSKAAEDEGLRDSDPDMGPQTTWASDITPESESLEPDMEPDMDPDTPDDGPPPPQNA